MCVYHSFNRFWQVKMISLLFFVCHAFVSRFKSLLLLVDVLLFFFYPFVVSCDWAIPIYYTSYIFCACVVCMLRMIRKKCQNDVYQSFFFLKFVAMRVCVSVHLNCPQYVKSSTETFVCSLFSRHTFCSVIPFVE